MHVRAKTKLATAGMAVSYIAATLAGPAPANAAPRRPRKPAIARTPIESRTHTVAAAERWQVDLIRSPQDRRPEPKPARPSPAQIAVATARSLIGTPYRYGGTTPRGFDCSGFTSYVWRKAGVSLPHSSSGQYASLPHVPRSAARAGDIVYSSGHVGLYIGGGQMIHSPQTGDHVKVSPIHARTIGFARPGG